MLKASNKCDTKMESNSTLHKRPWVIGTKQDRDYWEKKYTTAKLFMKSRYSNPSLLIEIAAQHPLVDGEKPNEEFLERLHLGKMLYDREKKKGIKVEIYVPGSLHVYKGRADKMSLSEAGVNFLSQLGIPLEVLHGDDLNMKYKGMDGVYNSADECFVAASYFKENNFGRLYSVLSPVQLFRKTLHYMEFGVLPQNYTAPVPETFHNYIGEIFEAIPYVLFVDPSMQGEGSIRSKEIREERKPKAT